MKITKTIQTLIDAAQAAQLNSYSPYSKYKVGAAVLTKEGKIYTGTNIENASYGLTVCAERNALFSAIGAGEKDFEAIAITAGRQDTKGEVSPCGACRQVMQEFFTPNTPVYVAVVIKGKVTQLTKRKLKDYLPFAFDIKSLKNKK